MPAAAQGLESPVEAAADQAAKSAGAFRTIGEVSDALAVPQHVLRFWETRFGQIRPVKRAGGRRYYRPEDVDLVAGIRHLLHERRYTIAGAQRLLKESGVRFVQAVGRGETAAAAPPPSQEGEPAAGGALSAADREDLDEALRELRACREALSGLLLPPAPVA